MDQCLNPHQHLAVIGNIKDNDICLACAAIGLSTKPNHGADFYTHQLAELSDAVHAYYIGFAGGDPSTDRLGRATQHDIIKKLAAIRAVVFDQYQFHNERSVNDPSAKTDFCDMLERRKGTPINLAILCMHLARSQGWAAEGIAIPGHFVCRLEANGERIIFDPFNRAKALNASDLRCLVKQTLGFQAELEYKHYSAIENRSILLKLQNNIKQQQKQRKNFVLHWLPLSQCSKSRLKSLAFFMMQVYSMLGPTKLKQQLLYSAAISNNLNHSIEKIALIGCCVY